MSPLVALLGCAALAAAGSIYVKKTPSRGSGGELGLSEAGGRALLCALQCELAGAVCVAIRMEGATCRLLSGLTAGQSDTFVRGCGSRRVAYRVIPPMTIPEAKAECAADGGRMAIPLSVSERSYVQELVDIAGATPGLLPADINRLDIAILGLASRGPPNYNITDLKGAIIIIPEEAWGMGEPNGRSDNVQPRVVISNGKLFDYVTGQRLMSVCERPL